MTVTIDMLNAVCGNSQHEDRKQAFLYRLYDEGSAFGMNTPEVAAQIIAQVAHESGRFRYVREVWGPTKAQIGYEGRADLGNVKPGDGKRYMGRDLIQVTGRDNYRRLTEWLKTRIGKAAPDFEANPELLESTTWLGIGVVWYFATTKRKAGRILDMCRAGDVEAVSRAVNGGTNGLKDRLDLYARTALVMLGRKPGDVAGFQKSAGLSADGVAGPKTRAALHQSLKSKQITPPATGGVNTHAYGLYSVLAALIAAAVAYLSKGN